LGRLSNYQLKQKFRLRGQKRWQKDGKKGEKTRSNCLEKKQINWGHYNSKKKQREEPGQKWKKRNVPAEFVKKRGGTGGVGGGLVGKQKRRVL